MLKKTLNKTLKWAFSRNDTLVKSKWGFGFGIFQTPTLVLDQTFYFARLYNFLNDTRVSYSTTVDKNGVQNGVQNGAGDEGYSESDDDYDDGVENVEVIDTEVEVDDGDVSDDDGGGGSNEGGSGSDGGDGDGDDDVYKSRPNEGVESGSELDTTHTDFDGVEGDVKAGNLTGILGDKPIGGEFVDKGLDLISRESNTSIQVEEGYLVNDSLYNSGSSDSDIVIQTRKGIGEIVSKMYKGEAGISLTGDESDLMLRLENIRRWYRVLDAEMKGVNRLGFVQYRGFLKECPNLLNVMNSFIDWDKKDLLEKDEKKALY